MTKKSVYKSEEGKRLIHGFYNEILKEWPQPSNQFLLNTQQGDTFVIESGRPSSPVVILLHGTGSNSAMWMADAVKLSEKYHLYAIDIPGECGFSAENRLPYGDNTFADWLTEIIDKLGIDKLSLAGCSLGGWIALDFAIRRPERVNKLVVTATAGISGIKPSTLLWIVVTSFAGKWGFNKLNSIVYGKVEIDKKALAFVSLVKDHFIPRTDVLPIFPDEELKKTEAPVLFIGGENDCFYDSHKTAARLQKNISGAECVILKETGHVLTDQTDRIISFLSDER